MRRRRLAAVLGFAAFAVAASAASPPRHAPVRHAPTAARDWSRTVVATPEGGFRMGNPAAKVKLIEYGSLSCPHCAEFEAEGGPTVIGYVKSGKMSWEFRTYLLFPTDPGVSLLLHCQPAAGFFRSSAELYATQNSWMDRLRKMPRDRLARFQTMGVTQRIVGLVHATGLDAYFRAHGMSAARINACLTSKAGLDRLLHLTERSKQLGVIGTPSFLINNSLAADTYDWAALAPQLAAVVH
jgi:protein-disulfide isomerase